MLASSACFAEVMSCVHHYTGLPPGVDAAGPAKVCRGYTCGPPVAGSGFVSRRLPPILPRRLGLESVMVRAEASARRPSSEGPEFNSRSPWQPQGHKSAVGLRPRCSATLCAQRCHRKRAGTLHMDRGVWPEVHC